MSKAQIVTLEKQDDPYGSGTYYLKINGITIYEWYLRPKQDKETRWEDQWHKIHIYPGTRYKNPVRSYPTLVGPINHFKLGSTLSVKQIYDTCVDFGILLDEFDADLRQLGWGNDINKWAFSTEEE